MENEVLRKDIEDFAAGFALAEDLSGRTIAITGATGLLGSCMVRCLLALNRLKDLGLHVIAVVRNKEKAVSLFGEECEELTYYCYDFSSDQPFRPVRKVDFLFHFAAPTASKDFVDKPVETMNTVYMGTHAILSYAKEANLMSLVLASTLEVYGTVTDDSHPLTEDMQGYLDPMATRSSYPLAKRAAEALCHNYAVEYGVPVKTARLAQTFGAGVAKTDNRVFAQFARSIITGEDIVLHTTGELSRCYCYTTDALAAMLHILLKGKDGEAYNVANEETYISIRNMAEYVAETFNPQVKVIINPLEGLGYSPTTKLRLDATRIKALGWQPRYGLREMFCRLINSMRED
ncbi:MAG: NAD-dependent epimerase/dehydratase family protein [Prevotella sp.]|nr:NAD-dependent epimerase/dehydratase family protein [Prevotella sp.]